MREENCILCGLPLKIGKTNLEHYVPQVLIRNFENLNIPTHFTHALRINQHKNFAFSQIISRQNHRSWATITVHEKCNLDASAMCRDLKDIIDHPLGAPSKEQNDRIAAYYGHLWKADAKSIRVYANCYVDDHAEFIKLYRPGSLNAGRIQIHCDADLASNRETERHTIYLGTEKGLQQLIR